MFTSQEPKESIQTTSSCCLFPRYRTTLRQKAYSKLHGLRSLKKTIDNVRMYSIIKLLRNGKRWKQKFRPSKHFTINNYHTENEENKEENALEEQHDNYHYHYHHHQHHRYDHNIHEQQKEQRTNVGRTSKTEAFGEANSKKTKHKPHLYKRELLYEHRKFNQYKESARSTSHTKASQHDKMSEETQMTEMYKNECNHFSRSVTSIDTNVMETDVDITCEESISDEEGEEETLEELSEEYLEQEEEEQEEEEEEECEEGYQSCYSNSSLHQKEKVINKESYSIERAKCRRAICNNKGTRNSKYNMYDLQSLQSSLISSQKERNMSEVWKLEDYQLSEEEEEEESSSSYSSLYAPIPCAREQSKPSLINYLALDMPLELFIKFCSYLSNADLCALLEINHAMLWRMIEMDKTLWGERALQLWSNKQGFREFVQSIEIDLKKQVEREGGIIALQLSLLKQYGNDDCKLFDESNAHKYNSVCAVKGSIENYFSDTYEEMIACNAKEEKNNLIKNETVETHNDANMIKCTTNKLKLYEKVEQYEEEEEEYWERKEKQSSCQMEEEYELQEPQLIQQQQQEQELQLEKAEEISLTNESKQHSFTIQESAKKKKCVHLNEKIGNKELFVEYKDKSYSISHNSEPTLHEYYEEEQIELEESISVHHTGNTKRRARQRRRHARHDNVDNNNNNNIKSNKVTAPSSAKERDSRDTSVNSKHGEYRWKISNENYYSRILPEHVKCKDKNNVKETKDTCFTERAQECKASQEHSEMLEWPTPHQKKLRPKGKKRCKKQKKRVKRRRRQEHHHHHQQQQQQQQRRCGRQRDRKSNRWQQRWRREQWQQQQRHHRWKLEEPEQNYHYETLPANYMNCSIWSNLHHISHWTNNNHKESRRRGRSRNLGARRCRSQLRFYSMSEKGKQEDEEACLHNGYNESALVTEKKQQWHYKNKRHNKRHLRHKSQAKYTACQSSRLSLSPFTQPHQQQKQEEQQAEELEQETLCCTQTSQIANRCGSNNHLSRMPTQSALRRQRRLRHRARCLSQHTAYSSEKLYSMNKNRKEYCYKIFGHRGNNSRCRQSSSNNMNNNNNININNSNSNNKCDRCVMLNNAVYKSFAVAKFHPNVGKRSSCTVTPTYNAILYSKPVVLASDFEPSINAECLHNQTTRNNSGTPDVAESVNIEVSKKNKKKNRRKRKKRTKLIKTEPDVPTYSTEQEETRSRHSGTEERENVTTSSAVTNTPTIASNVISTDKNLCLAAFASNKVEKNSNDQLDEQVEVVHKWEKLYKGLYWWQLTPEAKQHYLRKLKKFILPSSDTNNKLSIAENTNANTNAKEINQNITSTNNISEEYSCKVDQEELDKNSIIIENNLTEFQHCRPFSSSRRANKLVKQYYSRQSFSTSTSTTSTSSSSLSSSSTSSWSKTDGRHPHRYRSDSSDEMYYDNTITSDISTNNKDDYSEKVCATTEDVYDGDDEKHYDVRCKTHNKRIRGKDEEHYHCYYEEEEEEEETEKKHVIINKSKYNLYAEREETMLLTHAKASLIHSLKAQQEVNNKLNNTCIIVDDNNNNSSNNNNSNNNRSNRHWTTVRSYSELSNDFATNNLDNKYKSKTDSTDNTSSDENKLAVQLEPITWKFAFYMSIRDARRSLLTVQDLIENIWLVCFKATGNVHQISFNANHTLTVGNPLYTTHPTRLRYENIYNNNSSNNNSNNSNNNNNRDGGICEERLRLSNERRRLAHLETSIPQLRATNYSVMSHSNSNNHIYNTTTTINTTDNRHGNSITNYDNVEHHEVNEITRRSCHEQTEKLKHQEEEEHKLSYQLLQGGAMLHVANFQPLRVSRRVIPNLLNDNKNINNEIANSNNIANKHCTVATPLIAENKGDQTPFQAEPLRTLTRIAHWFCQQSHQCHETSVEDWLYTQACMEYTNNLDDRSKTIEAEVNSGNSSTSSNNNSFTTNYNVYNDWGWTIANTVVKIFSIDAKSPIYIRHLHRVSGVNHKMCEPEKNEL